MTVRTIRNASITASFIGAAALAASAHAQVFTVLVKDGDFFAGAGSTTNVSKPAVNNSGSWLTEVITDGPADINIIVVKDGAILLQENDVPGNVSPGNISSFDSHNLNNNGQYGSNLFLRNATTSTDSGVMRNNVMVIQESAISTAPQFSPNTPYIGWFETRLNDFGQQLLLASMDDPNIPTTADRALVIANISNAGALLSETVVIKEADQVPGLELGRLLVDVQTNPHNIAFNNLGQAAYIFDADGATTDDTGIVVGTTLIAREGSPSGIDGRNWNNFSSTHKVDINGSGGWAIVGSLAGDAATDLTIASNGVKVIQEGASLPAIGGVFTFTTFGTGALKIDDNNNVYWFGDWNDPDTTKDTGIFMNDQLLVQEGVTMIDGNLLTSISTIQDNFTVSDNGQYLVFRGVLANVGDAMIMVTIPEPGSATALLALGGLVLRRVRRGR